MKQTTQQIEALKQTLDGLMRERQYCLARNETSKAEILVLEALKVLGEIKKLHKGGENNE